MRCVIVPTILMIIFGCVSKNSNDQPVLSYEKAIFAPGFLKSSDFSLVKTEINTIFQISTKTSKKCLTITELRNGSIPVGENCNDSTNQKFEYEGSDLNHKRLRSLYSGKCLDVIGGTRQEGARIHQWDCLPHVESQKVEIHNRDEDHFEVVFKHSRKTLTFENSAYIQQENDPNSEDQSFLTSNVQIYQFIDPEATFRLKNEKSSLCLTVSGKNINDQIEQHRCGGESKQYFRKVLHGNNRISLHSVFSNKCLDLEDIAQENGKKIVQTTCDYSLNQIFEVVKKNGVHPPNSYDNLVAFRSGGNKCIDIMGASKAEAALAHQWDCYHGDLVSQHFRLEAKPIKEVKNIGDGASKVPKIIWGFWDLGEESLPILYRLNLDHWKKLNPDWQVRVINLVPKHKDSIFNILDEYGVAASDYLPSNWEQLENLAVTFKGSTGNAIKADHRIVKSDLIRLAILDVAGGVYSDLSNVMLTPLDDFFVDKFNKSPASVAGYSMQGYASPQSPISNGKLIDGFENWLIAAKKKSPFIEQWRKAFVGYWETRAKAQQTLTHPMYSDGTFDIGGMGFDQASYLNEHAAFKYTLQNHPDLAPSIYIVDWNPWLVHMKNGGGADQVAQTLTQDVDSLAADLTNKRAPLLKFSSAHLTTFNRDFGSFEDFCRKPNLFKIIYGLECS